MEEKCCGRMDGRCGEKAEGDCGCGKGHGGMRSFLTKEEKIDMLKEYKENLEKEMQGVKERISELEKKN